MVILNQNHIRFSPFSNILIYNTILHSNANADSLGCTLQQHHTKQLICGFLTPFENELS